MFHRSPRLFLRPPFPEDRDAILAVMGDRAVADAMAFDDDCGHFVLVEPAGTGAPIVGVASLARSATGLELSVRIGAAYRGMGYAAEARQALFAMARALNPPASGEGLLTEATHARDSVATFGLSTLAWPCRGGAMLPLAAA